MRILSATLLIAALAVSGCATLQIDGRNFRVPVWTTEGETPLRTNAVSTPLEPPLEMVWEFNAGAGFGSVSPLIIGDAVLVATRKGEVHAIDIESGNRIGQTAFGESIDGTPIIEDGVLYVPVSWGGKAVHAFDLKKGSTLWKVKDAPVSAGLVGYQDVVIAADVEGRVRAYGLRDGEIKWEATLGDPTGVKATPVLVDDRVIIGDDSGIVTALDASDGSTLWQTDIGAPVHVAPGATKETVYVPTTRGRLIALSVADGEMVWSYDLPSHEIYVTSPAIGPNDVVFGASDGRVRSLSRSDGQVNWMTEVEGAVTAPPLMTDKSVYVGTMRSKLIGLARSDGTHTWETELEGRIKSPFAVKGSQLVVLSEPRHVYLFEVSDEPYATREN